MSKRYGFELLEDQLVEHLSERIAYECQTMERVINYGTTPIEKLLIGALFQRVKYMEDAWFKDYVTVTDQKWMDALKARNKKPPRRVYLQKQAQLPNWRVDYIVHFYAEWLDNPGGGPVGWKELIVECDGHDFHERTKEQAAKDRARDREVQKAGFEIFRFTGSEIWKDPIGCAKQITDWVEKRA